MKVQWQVRHACKVVPIFYRIGGAESCAYLGPAAKGRIHEVAPRHPANQRRCGLGRRFSRYLASPAKSCICAHRRQGSPEADIRRSSGRLRVNPGLEPAAKLHDSCQTRCGHPVSREDRRNRREQWKTVVATVFQRRSLTGHGSSVLPLLHKSFEDRPADQKQDDGKGQAG